MTVRQVCEGKACRRESHTDGKVVGHLLVCVCVCVCLCVRVRVLVLCVACLALERMGNRTARWVSGFGFRV